VGKREVSCGRKARDFSKGISLLKGSVLEKREKNRILGGNKRKGRRQGKKGLIYLYGKIGVSQRGGCLGWGSALFTSLRKSNAFFIERGREKRGGMQEKKKKRKSKKTQLQGGGDKIGYGRLLGKESSITHS